MVSRMILPVRRRTEELQIWILADCFYAGGISQDWHLWTVTDHGDNSHPFSFRATNPHGSQYDQLNGGFFTGQFWVKIPEGSETSSSAMPSASSASRTSMSATSTQTTARKTSSSAIATGSASQNDSSNSTTVGVGAGVGVGGGVVLIAAGGFLWWLIRRRRQSKNPPPGQISPGDMRSTAGWSHGDSSTLWSQNGQPYYAPMGQTDPFYGGPQPGFNPWQPSELGPGQPLVEAPSNVEPKELAADGLKPKELAADGSNDRRKPPGEWD